MADLNDITFDRSAMPDVKATDAFTVEQTDKGITRTYMSCPIVCMDDTTVTVSLWKAPLCVMERPK